MRRVVLRAKCFNRHAPLSDSRSCMYLSIPKRSRRTHRGISRTSSSTTRISGQCSGRLGRQIDPAPVCATGGEPSTRSPPGELVEQALHACTRRVIPAQRRSAGQYRLYIAPFFWCLRASFSKSLSGILMSVWGSIDTCMILILTKGRVD